MSRASTNGSQLPVLDIQQWYDHPAEFVERLRSASHTVGFFLLRHDIPPELIGRQMEETRRFFQHSLQDKLSISYENNAAFRGYMRHGLETTSGKVDRREQLEYAAVYPNHPATPTLGPPYYERLKASDNPWPRSFQPTLESVTEAYLAHSRRIADCLRDALCLALGLNQQALDPIFRNVHDDPPHWVLKLIRYPALPAEAPSSDDPDMVSTSFGVGAHTDSNFLTLVLQNAVSGLQVFSQGDWIHVPCDAPADVLVCNLGEQAELWSRGYFLATPHRVLANVHGTEDRISLPLFYNPLLSATIEPISSCNANALLWEREDGAHWRMKDNTMLATVGDNTFKSLARSHAKVFAGHHGDLILRPDGSMIPREFSLGATVTGKSYHSVDAIST